jgi:hypothetical protein
LRGKTADDETAAAIDIASQRRGLGRLKAALAAVPQ